MVEADDDRGHRGDRADVALKRTDCATSRCTITFTPQVRPRACVVQESPRHLALPLPGFEDHHPHPRIAAVAWMYMAHLLAGPDMQIRPTPSRRKLSNRSLDDCSISAGRRAPRLLDAQLVRGNSSFSCAGEGVYGFVDASPSRRRTVSMTRSSSSAGGSARSPHSLRRKAISARPRLPSC